MAVKQPRGASKSLEYPVVLAAERRERDAREALSAARSDLVWSRAYGSPPDAIAALEERLRFLQDQYDDAARELHVARRAVQRGAL